MISKFILIVLILCLAMPAAPAFAVSGQEIITNMLYGAGIGSMLGAAIYYVFDTDNDKLGRSILTGAALGTIGGFFIAVTDAKSIVEAEKGEIKLSVPDLVVQRKTDETSVGVALLRYRY